MAKLDSMAELERIRAEYARRARDPHLAGLYSLFRPDALFAQQTRERAVLQLLSRAGLQPLDGFDLLEVGCGEGGVLVDLVRWGADPERLHGCDLLPRELAPARRRLPTAARLVTADGGALPYADARFDLVLQFTVFTSVLDGALRQRMAEEIWRVLRPGGAVVWYDFRFQGRNPAVRAIHPGEVQALFPEGALTGRRVTLAPPLYRRLARRSWLACELLARIPWLRSHDMLLIRKGEAAHG
jgi:ubiquinone/menaquinone biosynthesis C-methylase UbiE